VYGYMEPRAKWWLVAGGCGGVFVSLLATFAFKLCVEGDTGLKTGWV